MKLLALFLALTFYPPYDRGAFRHWIDADRDCQDTRAEILVARAINQESIGYRGRYQCSVLSGGWMDAYSLTPITGSATQVQIDHLVPLGEAWVSGAWEWTARDREEFANDPMNLVITSTRLNGSKGSKDIAEWVPPEVSRRCWYATAWRAVKMRYMLSYNAEEVEALMKIEKEYCHG